MATETTTPPTSAEEEPVRCDLCGAALANLSELEEHRQGHLEKAAEGLPPVPEGPRHRCAFCDAAFDTAEELSTHHAEGHRK